MSLRQEIDGFFTEKRIAVIGVSTDPKHFSRALFRDLKRRGYELIPVNPKADHIEGQTCYPSVAAIMPAPGAALIMTARTSTDSVVRDCVAAGVKHVWMYRAGGMGPGSVSLAAEAFCNEHGVGVVAGECPYMFLPMSGFPHNVHGWCRKAFHAELR